MLNNVPGASLATVAERAAQLRMPFHRPPATVAKITKADITLGALPWQLAECWTKIAAWIAANGVCGDAC